jgi:hypothetical protein
MAALFAEHMPRVKIERWTGFDGWPVWRVFYLAALFGEDGERYVECPDHAAALEAAAILAGCTGWPIEDCPPEHRR